MRFFALFLVLVGFLPAWPAQETPKDTTPQGEFFSGTVFEITAQKVTVSRTVLSKESVTRSFAITPETKVEGRPRVKSRVTVRFVSAEDGDRALHIIVRPPQQKK